MNTRGFVLALGMALCGLMAVTASPANAATITVTANAADVLNGANASCALREAITNVNNAATTYADCANTGAAYGTSDTINIPAGTYTNAIASTDEQVNVNGSLDILRSVAIAGAGASTTFINGGGIDRVLYVNAAGGVSISGVTIQNGYAYNTDGGGVYITTTLTINDSTIKDNGSSGYRVGKNRG